MKKIILALVLVLMPSMLFAEKNQAPATSWTNPMNTPFFVSVIQEKSDYDHLADTTKSSLLKYLSENAYRYKTEKDDTAFMIEITKTPTKDKTEISISDISTKEGIVPSNIDNSGKDTMKKFADVMKSWDKNGALYKVVFQGMSFKEIQAMKEKLTADRNYGGLWQTADESVLLSYKGTPDSLIDAVVKGSDTIEPLKVEGRKITFKSVPAPAKEEATKETKKESKKAVKKEEEKDTDQPTADKEPEKKKK